MRFTPFDIVFQRSVENSLFPLKTYFHLFFATQLEKRAPPFPKKGGIQNILKKFPVEK